MFTVDVYCGCLLCLPQIEEVALVTTKGTNQRRGFCFVTYISEDSVDKCTDKTFHSLDNHQVWAERRA